MKSFDRLVLLIVMGLVLVLGVVVVAGNQAGLSEPVFQLEKGQVGARGPLTLVFSEPITLESVESRLKIDPPLQGRLTTWQVQGRRPGYAVSFWPEQPLQTGQQYTIALEAGVRAQTGLELRKPASWQFSVRDAEIWFLSPPNSPEIWQAAGDGSNPVQVTQTGGAVFDFDVSPDGNRVIYSAINEQQGIDLWELDRWTQAARLLLPCERDWCSNPAFSPDGTVIAYSRRRSGALPDEGPGVPRIWLLNMQELSTDMLYADPNIGGYDPSWSPDGKYLAFFDGLAQGVRVLDLGTGTDFLLNSQMGMVGKWSPDSRRIMFVDFMPNNNRPDVAVFQVDVQSQQIRRAFGDETNQVDFSVPAWSPDGETLVVGMGYFMDGPGKQLWLMDQDGRQRQQITSDPIFTHASYHWAPSGGRIVFQRLEMGRSGTLPQVVVWDRATGATTLVAENAFLPLWAP